MGEDRTHIFQPRAPRDNQVVLNAQQTLAINAQRTFKQEIIVL